MGPGIPPCGTVANIWFGPQPPNVVAITPLNVTELEPLVRPNPLPLIVTDVPTLPEVGDTLLMPGAEVTVNGVPLLATPPTVTTTLPLVAPDGTGTTMLVVVQLRGVAVSVPNFTVLVPWVEPKFVPEIVTAVPMPPPRASYRTL